MNMGNKNAVPRVSIIMGSESDLHCMKSAAQILEEFKVSYEIKIISAHRTPNQMFRFAQEATDRGIECIIAGAGGAAHLPGMVASLTPLPVIGVPILSSALSGNDSLLSIVQMPKGVPVATVAIHNATNAGLLAVRMLGIKDFDLHWKMKQYLSKQETDVLEKAKRLETLGYKQYISKYIENKKNDAFQIPNPQSKKNHRKTFIKKEKMESMLKDISKLKRNNVIDLTKSDKATQVVEEKEDDIKWWK